jgi:catechol 2,3-dioxygenase-like lactoylglutathione lyase family enzyme
VTAASREPDVGPVGELRLVLTVDNLDEAVAFYRDALGLEQLAAFENDGGRGFLLGAGRATLELFDQAQAEAIDAIEVGRRVAGPVRLAFEVGDCDAAAASLAALGATVKAQPVDTPWGDRNARLVAPDGMQLTLYTTPERTRPTRSANEGR